MKDIEIKEVIVSTIRTRGDGTKLSPSRRIIEVFEKDGALIAESDPTPDGRFTVSDLINFHRWFVQNYKSITPSNDHIQEWIEEER